MSNGVTVTLRVSSSPSPSPTPTPTQTTTAQHAPVPTPSHGGSELSMTGAPVTTLLAIAAVCTAVGGLLSRVRTRPERRGRTR